MNTFSFLMHLNLFSNRSYNDLSQYPIFPWLVKDIVELMGNEAKNFSCESDIKSEISKLSIAKLNKNSAEAKHCNRCGKILEWNYPYTICQECYYGSRRHYNYYDDFYY